MEAKRNMNFREISKTSILAKFRTLDFLKHLAQLAFKTSQPMWFRKKPAAPNELILRNLWKSDQINKQKNRQMDRKTALRWSNKSIVFF